MTTVRMPTFVELLDGLDRRGLSPELRGGRLTLVGDMSTIDPVVMVAVRWHAGLLRAVVLGRETGHIVGVCDRCGEWTFIHKTKTPRCRMTPGCKGKHQP
jgi:hypothetical protein